jgi:hypothetical protein
MLKKQKHLGDEQKATQLRLSGTSGFSVPGGAGFGSGLPSPSFLLNFLVK